MQKLIAAALFCFGSYAVNAQPGGQADTGVNASYNQKIAISGDLYYGVEHLGYPQQMNGTPYFESNEWQKGSVTYNNVLYKDVLLKYDMLSDAVIALHPNNFFSVTLISEKVQSFTIGDDAFVFVPGSNQAGLKDPGFYHLLINGKLSILVKRSKLIEEKPSINGVERNIIQKEQFYAIKDGMASTITNEESVMRLLGEHERQVRTHLRAKEIKFKKLKEIALIEIAIYYNQLAK